MARFENPNDPRQPQEGVYCWRTERNGERQTLYVGRAGGRNSLLAKGTLFRGAAELQRNTFASSSYNAYRTVDTDFVVGTAILFFEEQGFSCIWKHIDNDPHTENRYVANLHPLLQNGNGRIRIDFRLPRDDPNHWRLDRLPRDDKEARIAEAQASIFALLQQL